MGGTTLSNSRDGPEQAAVPAGAARPARWRVALRGTVWRLAHWAEPLCRGRRWAPSALAVGVLPVLVGYAVGSPEHRIPAALALVLLCLNCARTDAWRKAYALIATAFAAHCVVAIALGAADAERAAAVLPDAEAYWQKQWTWITTGSDPEYELAAWVPAHAQLLAGTTLLSFTSLGAFTFEQGLYEVDLMNFYNARLLSHSVNRPLAVAIGWHPWSLLRGAGYVLLTYEILSLALQVFSGRRLAAWPTRGRRLTAGVGFLLADGLVKYFFLETVRQQLFANLV